MANPFDDVVKVDNPEGHPNPHPPPKTHYHHPPHKDRDVISIKLNKRMAERSFYIVIIIVLGLLVYFDPFDNSCDSGLEAVTGQVVLQEVTEEEVEEVAEEEVEEEVAEEEPEEELEEVVVKSSVPKPVSGNLDLTIDKVDFKRNDDGDPSSIEEVQISISNRWNPFTAKVKLYFFDSTAGEVFVTKIRLEKVLGRIEVGKKYSFTFPRVEFDSTFFWPGAVQEKIRVDLIDAGTSNQLAYQEYTVR